MSNPALHPQELSTILTGWARNDRAPNDHPAVCVVESEHRQWLADPAHDLLGPDSVVLVRGRNGRAVTPEVARGMAPGRWLAYQGELDAPGDEIQVGSDFWLQSMDYYSARFMAIAGPTVIRLADAHDAESFAHDAVAAIETGAIESALLSPAVEIGDRCLLAGHPCTMDGRLPRLHVGSDGVVRTAPTGLGLGSVGEPRALIADRAAAFAAEGLDVCASKEINAALTDATLPARRLMLAATDAMRTMALRTKTAWWVSGIHGDVVPMEPGWTTDDPRPDLLVLFSDQSHVLFDVRQHRAFTIGRDIAGVLEVLLRNGSAEHAARRWVASGHPDAQAAAAVGSIVNEFSARGVDFALAS